MQRDELHNRENLGKSLGRARNGWLGMDALIGPSRKIAHWPTFLPPCLDASFYAAWLDGVINPKEKSRIFWEMRVDVYFRALKRPKLTTYDVCKPTTLHEISPISDMHQHMYSTHSS